MSDRIETQERFYQRGLVLGFTVAEIFLLIIFAILLAIAAFINQKDSQINKVSQLLEIRERQLKEKEKELAYLKENVSQLESVNEKANAFDDFFRELVLSQAEAPRSLSVAEKMSTLRSQLNTLREQAQLSMRLASMVKQADSSQENAENLLKVVEKRMEVTRSIEQRLKATGYPHDIIKGWEDGTLAKLIDLNVDKTAKQEQIAQLEAEKKNLQEQIRNQQRTLNAIGSGTEMPACWANAETGKPEFIYDVTLTSTGIIIHDNALPNRLEDKAHLPIGDVVCDKEMTLSQFLSSTRLLFDWSKNHGCRFFVRILDRTSPTEKDIYKKNLWTVGQHFYYFESHGPKE